MFRIFYFIFLFKVLCIPQFSLEIEVPCMVFIIVTELVTDLFRGNSSALKVFIIYNVF